MPISFATNKEIPVGSAYIGIPTGIDADGDTTVSAVFKADKDHLAEVLMFAGTLRALAARLAAINSGPIAIYNPDDYDQHGPELPYGFEFPDE